MQRKKSSTRRVKGGLTTWLEEKWVDVKTGKPCGRSQAEKKDVVIQLVGQQNEISSKTPKTLGEMTAAEKARFKREKTGKAKIKYQHRRKKTTKKK